MLSRDNEQTLNLANKESGFDARAKGLCKITILQIFMYKYVKGRFLLNGLNTNFTRPLCQFLTKFNQCRCSVFCVKYKTDFGVLLSRWFLIFNLYALCWPKIYFRWDNYTQNTKNTHYTSRIEDRKQVLDQKQPLRKYDSFWTMFIVFLPLSK